MPYLGKPELFNYYGNTLNCDYFFFSPLGHKLPSLPGVHFSQHREAENKVSCVAVCWVNLPFAVR